MEGYATKRTLVESEEDDQENFKRARSGLAPSLTPTSVMSLDLDTSIFRPDRAASGPPLPPPLPDSIVSSFRSHPNRAKEANGSEVRPAPMIALMLSKIQEAIRKKLYATKTGRLRSNAGAWVIDYRDALFEAAFWWKREAFRPETSQAMLGKTSDFGCLSREAQWEEREKQLDLLSIDAGQHGRFILKREGGVTSFQCEDCEKNIKHGEGLAEERNGNFKHLRKICQECIHLKAGCLYKVSQKAPYYRALKKTAEQIRVFGSFYNTLDPFCEGGLYRVPKGRSFRINKHCELETSVAELLFENNISRPVFEAKLKEERKECLKCTCIRNTMVLYSHLRSLQDTPWHTPYFPDAVESSALAS